MKKAFLMTMFLVAILFAGGCGNNEESSESSTPVFTPGANDNVTWDAYGNMPIEGSGNDSTARKIISNCGWHVYKNHNGGYGDTLQIAPPEEEVVLVWVNNQFSVIKLNANWKGFAPSGIKIGSTLQEVQAAYPAVKLTYSNTYILENSSKRNYSRVYFDFDSNGKLIGMTIS